ncbi:MAG: hypothetical protein HY843_02330 [Bdellovibrio sp.]|nr:hypothetical protein [Bdellovibrio sp.]
MKNFVVLLPEIYLIITLLGTVAGEAGYHGEGVRLIKWTALMGLGAAFFQVLILFSFEPVTVFQNIYRINHFKLFFKLFFITLGIITFLISDLEKEIEKNKMTEFSILILTAVLSLCVLTSAEQLVFMFLAIQLFMVTSYFLISLDKKSVLPVEAGIKYFVIGTLASVFFVLGIMLIFLLTRSFYLNEIRVSLLGLQLNRETLIVLFALVFFIFFTWLGLFPVYFWLVDVFEGAPTLVSAFLSIASKAAGVCLFISLIFPIFTHNTAGLSGGLKTVGFFEWPLFLAVIIVITFGVGAVLSLQQNQLKKLVAYFSMIESSYLLLGFIILDQNAMVALLYHLIVQLFSLMGLFYLISYFQSLGIRSVEEFRGDIKKFIPEVISFFIFFIGLIGFPPSPGFISKVILIEAVFANGWSCLAFFSIMVFCLELIAFCRIGLYLITAFGQDNLATIPIITTKENHSNRILLWCLVLPVFLTGIFCENIFDFLRYTVQ